VGWNARSTSRTSLARGERRGERRVAALSYFTCLLFVEGCFPLHRPPPGGRTFGGAEIRKFGMPGCTPTLVIPLIPRGAVHNPRLCPCQGRSPPPPRQNRVIPIQSPKSGVCRALSFRCIALGQPATAPL